MAKTRMRDERHERARGLHATLAVIALVACERRESTHVAQPLPSGEASDSRAPPNLAPSTVVRTEKLPADPWKGATSHRMLVWPERVCSTAAGLVVEHGCGCGEALTCTASVSGGTVDLEVHTTGVTGDCDDCHAMTPATCVLAPLPVHDHHVRIHGAAVFDVHVEPDGRLEQGVCWKGP